MREIFEKYSEKCMSYLKALVEGLVGSVPAVEFAVAHVGNEISSMHLKDTSYHIAHIVNHYKMFFFKSDQIHLSLSHLNSLEDTLELVFTKPVARWTEGA